MKKTILLALLCTGCATSYQDAAKSNYIGNGQFEIKVAGNDKTESDTIRGFIYRRAFETCHERDKGFVVTESLQAIAGYERNIWTGMKNNESYRMVVKCEGAVDQELAKMYAPSPRVPASK